MKIDNFLTINTQRGQSLITLLFFMAIGITVTTAAALVISADILATSNSEKGLAAYFTAESGVEGGILYVLRNHPTTTQTLTLSNATVTITYDSATQKNTVSSVGLQDTTKRTVSAQTSFSGGTISVSGWREQ